MPDPQDSKKISPADRLETNDRLKAYILGKELAMNVTTYWGRAKKADSGPVNVLDMFCGCGGFPIRQSGEFGSIQG